MQNRCETQFKIQKTQFRKLTLICLRKKGSQQKESKKPSGHFNTKVFLFENVEKHEIGDAKGDKKKEKKTKKQFEPDGRWNKKNMCSKNKKTRGKRKTQREQSEKKGDEQMKKCKEEDKNQWR